MMTYEFYSRHPTKGYQLVGVLPERRKDPARITQESVVNWGRIYFARNFEIKNVFFFQVTMNKNTGRVSRTNPFFVT